MATSLVSQYDYWSFQAGSASLAQFQFCTLNGSGQLVTPAATGVFAVVLDDAPHGATLSNDLFSGGYVVGNYYTCVLKGVQKVISGASLGAGVAVMTDTSGHAIAETGAGKVILGWTLAACNSGDLVSILLDRSIANS